jgi:hypothetical protein
VQIRTSNERVHTFTEKMSFAGEPDRIKRNWFPFVGYFLLCGEQSKNGMKLENNLELGSWRSRRSHPLPDFVLARDHA